MQPRFKATILLLLSVGLFASGTVIASQESDLAYSLGVQSLTAQNYQEAREHFAKVMELDPTHAQGRYYLAVSQEKLDDNRGALATLQNLTGEQSGHGEAWLLKGIVEIKLKKSAASLSSLGKAGALMPNNANVYYYTALAQQAAKDYSASLVSLRKSAELDSKYQVAAHYFQGVAHLALNDTARAVEQLEAAKQRSPSSGFGLKAADLLERLEAKQERGAPFSASASLGFEFDTNVLLEPDSIEISDEEDFRGVLFLAGRYQAAPFSATYSFYQSQHLELDDFNVQSHRLAFEVLGQDQELQAGARASTALALITNSLAYYSLTNVFEPFLLKKLGDSYTVGVQGRVHYIDFRGADDLRDNVGYGLSFNHLLQLMENRLFLGIKGGLQFEDADREYDLFKLTSEAQIGVEWLSLFWNITGGFDRSRFFRNSADREDHRIAGGAGVSKKFGAFSASASYQYSDNDSNVAQFTYLRQIASLNFGYAF